MEKVEFKVFSNAGTEIQIVNAVPTSFQTFAPSVFDHQVSIADFGNMIYNVYRTPRFTIWFCVYHTFYDTLVKGWYDQPIVELSIPLHDPYLSVFDGVSSYAVQPNQFELHYFPYVNHEVNLKQGMRTRTFDVHFPLAYLQQFTGHSKRLDAFLAGIANGHTPVSLLRQPQFLSTAMIRLINSIIHFDMQDEVAPYFFEGAVMQLICYVLDRAAGIDPQLPKLFSPFTKERTMQAKEIMLSHLNTRYTTEELATQVFLSESTLHECFRFLYGDTIFQYGQTVRLQKAADLLLLYPTWSVQEVAEEVGYKNNSNFTNAFKTVYGCTPDYHRRHGQLSHPHVFYPDERKL